MFYIDTKLNFHWIESTSVKNVAIIEKALKKLGEVQQKYADDSAPVVSLLNLIADLAKIPRSLLFDDIENVLNAIATVNFSVQTVDTEVTQPTALADKETISLDEFHYQLVAQLVNTELCDLPNAMRITSEQPFKDVEGILKARIKFLNRDKIEEEKRALETKELEKVVDRQIVDGTFYDDLLDPSTAGKVPIDLAGLKN